MKEAQAVIKNTASETMTRLDERYRYQGLRSTYAGIDQRWLRVESKRALKTVNRQVLKANEQEAGAFQTLCHQTFACYLNAEQALKQFQTTLRFTTLEEVAIEARPYYDKPGRPATEQKPTGVRFRLSGVVATALEPRNALLVQKSRFIVATNELDAEKLPPAKLLAAYKQQSHVEKGFRFLKDPLFLASSLFLKSPQRIMALLMVMTLCLLVYSALEYRVRQALHRPWPEFPRSKRQTDRYPHSTLGVSMLCRHSHVDSQ